MKPLDKNYLLLQFRDRIYSKNGTEFQSFFENIMEKVFPDFKKVPSGGGDGGNDGWIKELGRYYQVYAPNTPAIKESEAAKKLEKDFYKIYKNWDNISEIKEYYFVFNDKYIGSKKPDVKIAELKKIYPNIHFEIFLARNLETLFFTLNESDILNLGFNIDSRQSVSMANEYLQKVKIELDRENAIFAFKILENSKDIISEINDENLSLEFEILECRCLQKIEKVDEAKEKYENISIRFLNDPRPFLYLAEIHLLEDDFYKNEELLEKASKINGNHELLKIEKLIRQIHLGEAIDVTNIDESAFPDDLCVFLRKLPPNPEITLPLIPSSNTLVDSNTKVAGLRQLFV